MISQKLQPLLTNFCHGQTLDGCFEQFASNLNQTVNLVVLPDNRQPEKMRAAVPTYMSTIVGIALLKKISVGDRKHCR